MKKYILPIMALAVLSSCDDFLTREPLTYGNPSDFYHSEADLMMGANDFYANLPVNNDLWGGLWTADCTSDNQVANGLQSLLYEGDKRTPQMNSSQPWWFRNMRGINYFINRVKAEKEAGSINGSEANINHYLGEGYFFRAYCDFSRLISLGDTPILTEMLPDDKTILAKASVRQPRNIVARHIIADLDTAIMLMEKNTAENNRVSRDAALLLKSRVALFEATWERYHANTCFVPGNSKWPGSKHWPDFAWPAGSAEAEVEWFLDQAIEASEMVASAHPLNRDYASMFNSTDVWGYDHEVILARYYLDGVKSHSCSALLKSGGGCNLTRAAVNTYVMQNGLPIYAENSGYHGDLTSYEELMDRDGRLQQTVRGAGSFIEGKQVDGKWQPDTIFHYRPYIYVSGNEKATTGYEMKKWLSDEPSQRQQYHCTTTVPIMRAAEAYLNYIEAYYERYGSLNDKCDSYWRALRRRAGVDEDYNKTIAATDLSQENDLAVWSRGNEVSKTLYNIRRERRCELMAEGFRLNDLKRWRSLDKMRGYQPQGFNLWGGPIHEMYSSSELRADIVSQESDGDYLMPLRLNSTSPVYDGYNFPKAHYLEPIPVSEFLLTEVESTQYLYQNPGWPDKADGVANYNGYDYD